MPNFISNKDIISDILNNVSQKYFKLDELDQNLTSNYGYITDVMAKSIEDTLNINVTRSQNYIPELAANETIVRETAKLRDIGISSASPSDALATLTIVKNDILNRGETDSNGLVTFYIDKRSTIINNKIHYSLLSDIIIRAIPSPNGYVFSASYVGSINSYIQAYDDYMDTTPVLNIIVNIQQIKYDIQEDVVLDPVEFMYSGLGFEYNDKLAGFDLYYKVGMYGEYIKINSKYYLIDAKNENDDCLYYNDDNPGIVYILNNPNLNLATNTYIRIELKETLGSEGVIPLGIGDTSFELYKDTTYAYAGIAIYADIIDAMNNGKDGDSVLDIQYNLIRAKTYRNNITTDNDILNYINDKKANVQIIKKRIDFNDRLYHLYTLLRSDNEIMPATTKNLLIGEVDFDNIDSITGIKHLNSDNKFIVGLDDVTRKTNKDSIDDRCLCLPFLTVFDSSNIPYYYFQTINENYGLETLTNNVNNPYQSISREINISRNQFDVSKTYNLKTTISLNTSNDSLFVDKDGNILDTDSIRGYVLFRNGIEVVAYCELDLTGYDKQTRIFSLAGKFSTDDFITDDKKIHIVSGLKEVKTGLEFKGLIDYADIVFDTYFFCKKNLDFTYDKLLGSEIYEYLIDIDNHDYMNSYSNKTEHANLLIEMNSFSRSDAVIYKNGATSYDVIEGMYRADVNQSNITIEDFDYIRDYVVLAINRVIQKIGIDYIFDSNGIHFLNKEIPKDSLVTYFVFKNYDDKTLLKFERVQHIIADDVPRFKLFGFSSTTDILQVSSPTYGVLLPSEYLVDSDNYLNIKIPVRNDDIFDVLIFKNSEKVPNNLTLTENETYRRITNGYCDILFPNGLNDYCIEKDFIEIRTAESSRPLVVGKDYHLTYDSKVRIQSKYVIDGSVLYINTIKNYKNDRDIIIGNIAPPDNLVVIPDFNKNTDTVELFHKDIKLVEDTDYSINDDNSINLLNFTIKSRLEITYRLFKNISLISYSVEKDYMLIRGKYIPDRLNIERINIPNFVYNEDGIRIIKNNTVLVNSVDYIIEDDGSIYFLLTPLMIGDDLEYEIVKVYDVTNKLKIIDKDITIDTETDTIDVPEITEYSYMEVAIMQTPMRILEDYRIVERTKIVFLNGSLSAGEVVNLRFYKTVNQYGDIVRIVNESVDINEDNVTYIPLTKYDHEKDILLNVNYNQTSLIAGRDYDNTLNGMDIVNYSFNGSDNPLVVKNFNKSTDFIRVYSNGKILNPGIDYTVDSTNRVNLLNVFVTDKIMVTKYSNLMKNSYATYYTYKVTITQNGQKYIKIYDTNTINSIYYKGKVLRRNIDYVYNSDNIVLYNINTVKDDVLIVESVNIIDPSYKLATSYYTYNSGLSINIPEYNHGSDYLTINYNGRVLFNGIDYNIDNNGNLSMVSIKLFDGDILHYSLIKNYFVIFSNNVNGISIKDATLNTGDHVSVSIVKPVISGFEISTTSFSPNTDKYSNKIYIDGYSFSKDYVIVNYNETILNEGEHYVRNIDNSISLLGCTIDTTDTLYFIIIKNVRDLLDVSVGYVSGPENLMIIPNFNKKYDKLELAVDGYLLREVSDYTVDSNNKITFKGFSITSDSIAHYKVFKYYNGTEDGRYTTKLIEVPFIQYNYLKEYVDLVYNEIIKIKNTYSSLMQLITGFDINLKFTSTYGRSKYIYIMDKNLNNLNPNLKFKVYGRDINISDIKEFIIQYFRNTYISDSTIFISNICRAIENNFQEVKGITYLGTDNFNSTYQKIFYKKPDLSTSAKLLAYIPECLNVVDITIEVEEI